MLRFFSISSELARHSLPSDKDARLGCLQSNSVICLTTLAKRRGVHVPFVVFDQTSHQLQANNTETSARKEGRKEGRSFSAHNEHA
jgi:hypothetical protein